MTVVLSTKEFQQWRDLVFETRNFGCVSTYSNQFRSVFFTCAAASSRMKYYYTKNYIKTQSRRQGRKKKKKETAKEEWWRRARRASCAKPSPPVKQIKLESRGSAAKSRAESESFSGTEIIPHSSVVLTNPGSACATLAPRDNMTQLKTETGRDSKRKSPDSVEHNPCQDDQ